MALQDGMGWWNSPNGPSKRLFTIKKMLFFIVNNFETTASAQLWIIYIIYIYILVARQSGKNFVKKLLKGNVPYKYFLPSLRRHLLFVYCFKKDKVQIWEIMQRQIFSKTINCTKKINLLSLAKSSSTHTAFTELKLVDKNQEITSVLHCCPFAVLRAVSAQQKSAGGRTRQQ